MAARLKIIILDKPVIQENPNVFRYVFWADVPAQRQAFFANPAAESAWKERTQADVDQLKSGAVKEQVATIQVIPGTGMAAVQAELQARWQSYQDQVTTLNPCLRYGSTWDGTTWVLGGVA